MEKLLERCAALDVHKRQVTACAHVPNRRGERAELRAEFETMTPDLLALRDWLKGLGVTHVAANTLRAELPFERHVELVRSFVKVAREALGVPLSGMHPEIPSTVLSRCRHRP